MSDYVGRREFLRSSIAVMALVSRVSSSGCPLLRAHSVGLGAGRGLCEIAARHQLFYGSETNGRHIREDSSIRAAVIRDCAVLTSSYDFRWDKIWAKEGEFDWGTADFFANWTNSHGIHGRAHPILWHQSTPAWVSSHTGRNAALALMRRYIATVVGRYRRTIACWDVANEVLRPGDGLAYGLRGSYWYHSVGPDYVERAFRLAHEASPSAVLVLNEAGLEYPSGRSKRAAMLRLLEHLRHDDTPIHALGIQGHLRLTHERLDAIELRQFLDEVGRIGVRVFVTEMDVTDDDLPGPIRVRDKIVADTITEFLDVVLSSEAVAGVMTWGLSDHLSWLSGYRPRRDGTAVRPLLLDDQFRPKVAWSAVASAFQQAEPRRPFQFGS